MLLDLAFKSALLLSAAALVCALAPRAPAAHRHFVWTLAVFGVLALPLLTAAPWRLPVLPQRAAFVSRAELAQPRGERASRLDPVDPARVARREAPAAEPIAPAPDGARWWSAGNVTPAQVALAVYLAGVSLCLLRLLGSAVALRRIMREARDVYDDDWIDALEPALRQLDVDADVRLVASNRAAMPMTFGALKPVVVLPGNADAWTPELRRVVLLHELAHVRRRDMLVNVAAQLACAVYWFNPLMWAAARRLRHEAERAADDLVLTAGAAPSRYAAHLLDMVQAVLARRAPALALPMAQRSAFEGRVLAILAPGVARGTLTRRGVVAGSMVALLVALPLAALTPREVRGVVQEPAASVRAAAPETVANGSARTRTDTAVTTRPATNSVIADAPAVLDGATGARKDEPRPSSPSAVLALIGALDDDDVAVRVAAARALGDRADTVAINALLAALRRDTSPQVRQAAAWALGEIEDARAVGGLIAALREEREREVRLAIVHALGEIESETAVAGLATALRGEGDVEMRRKIVWALGEIESADAVPALLPLLRDPDAELRAQAVWALGEIESSSAVDGLVAMMGTERNAEVRARIIWALAEIEDPSGAPALEAALRDSDVEVRRNAARGLGELDGLRTIPAGLLTAMRDADPEVRMLAAHAAGEIQDPAAVPALILLLRDASLDVRRQAVHALGEMRSASAAEALVAALRDEDPEIRRLAAQALGNR
jgi:HEAT repeat protein/beta-lactamase regulating signal transducer with metallopeptidase domain